MISLHMKLMGIIIIFSLYQNEYYELVNINLKLKKSKIDKYVNRNNEPDISKIKNALRINQLDVAYYLLYTSILCVFNPRWSS